MRVQNSTIVAPPQPNAYGLYTLQGHEDCTTPYVGPYKASTIYIVGYTTEHERLFRRSDRNRALQYQTEASPGTRLSILMAPATMLCSSAVEALYA